MGLKPAQPDVCLQGIGIVAADAAGVDPPGHRVEGTVVATRLRSGPIPLFDGGQPLGAVRVGDRELTEGFAATLGIEVEVVEFQGRIVPGGRPCRRAGDQQGRPPLGACEKADERPPL